MWRLQNNVDRTLVGNTLEYVSFDDKLSILTGTIVSLLYTVIDNIFAVNKDCVIYPAVSWSPKRLTGCPRKNALCVQRPISQVWKQLWGQVGAV